MKEILSFLRELSQNNNREWFEQNKERYRSCHATFVIFTEQLIARLSEIDPELQGLTARDCIWRIYRDVRFSLDKRPYKEWFGTFPAAKGGKKSQHAGYYVHIQPGQCMVSAGIWSPVPDLLRALRREIEANYEEVEHIIGQPSWQRYFTDFDEYDMLKKVPVGFDPTFVHAEWLKRKSFTCSTPLTDADVIAPDFLEHVVDICSAAKPMNDFLNYTFEEYGEFPNRC